MADANHKFCCVVTPQSALLPQSCILGVIPSPVDFWKKIYYEEKIVLVGKSKWKNFQICQTNVKLLHSTLLRSALLPSWLVMRFTSLTIWTTLHCNWHWESVDWKYSCLNLITTPLFEDIVKKNNILGLFFWDFVCHTILVFCWILGFELKGCQTRDCKCQLLHDFSARERERGLCGRTVRIITPAFVAQLDQTLLPLFNWSPNIQESESEMLRFLHSSSSQILCSAAFPWIVDWGDWGCLAHCQ